LFFKISRNPTCRPYSMLFKKINGLVEKLIYTSFIKDSKYFEKYRHQKTYNILLRDLEKIDNGNFIVGIHNRDGLLEIFTIVDSVLIFCRKSVGQKLEIFRVIISGNFNNDIKNNPLLLYFLGIVNSSYIHINSKSVAIEDLARMIQKYRGHIGLTFSESYDILFVIMQSFEGKTKS